MFEEIRFPGQHEDENFILFFRRHWFIFFMRLLMIIGAIIGLVALFVFFTLFSTNLPETNYYNLLLFGESLGTLLIWNFFFILWLDFYLDAWIVTEERIINISPKGFFNRAISEV